MPSRSFRLVLVLAFLGGALRAEPKLPGIGPDGEGLRAHIDAATKAVLPAKVQDNAIFADYQGPNGPSKWATGWTGKVDLSGATWDNPPSNVILVSPCHVVMANHSKKKPIGRRVVFNNPKGEIVPAVIKAIFKIGQFENPDICVGLLDREVPVRFYKVLPPRTDYHDLLVGAAVFVTDQERRLYLHRISRVQHRRITFSRLTKGDPKNLQKKLIGGDSGAPSFVLVHGEPVLVETHTYGGGGQGPFFSQPENFKAVNEAMKALGGEYQLTVVKFGGEK